MRKALLTIVTKQPDEGENLTFTTRTDCTDTEAGMTLKYEESLSEEDTVSTQLLIGEDSILVERTGSAGGDMFFKEATTYETQYRALGGLELPMKIFTTNLNMKKDENGVRASVDYQLFLAGSSVGKLGMDIKVEFV